MHISSVLGSVPFFLFDMLPKFYRRLFQILFASDAVSVKHRASFVTTDFHANGFRHTRTH
jgi:hypothetical protein